LKSGRIEVSDRAERIARFMREVEDVPMFSFALAWQRLVVDHVCKEPDTRSLDRFHRLLIVGG
jgi:hypothetical protein